MRFSEVWLELECGLQDGDGPRKFVGLEEPGPAEHHGLREIVLDGERLMVGEEEVAGFFEIVFSNQSNRDLHEVDAVGFPNPLSRKRPAAVLPDGGVAGSQIGEIAK